MRPEAVRGGRDGKRCTQPIVFARVFAPFAFGYYLSYVFRTVNAVIAPDLSHELGLEADDLGLLTSAYFLSFAAAQLPLGIVLDRFGPRRTEAALLVLAAIGALIFSMAHGVTMLIAARALIGLGVSACLMAAFKAFVQNFARQRLPLVNGCQMAAGGLGAMTATVPVEAIVAASSWRTVFSLLSILSLTAAFFVLIIVPRRRQTGQDADPSLRAALAGLVAILTNPLFWRVAPMMVASQGSFLAIQSLWAGPWLRDVGGLDRSAVADTLLAIAAAMVAGYLLIGLAADRLGKLNIPPLVVAMAGITMFALTIAAIVIRASASPVLWLAFGFFGTSGSLLYAALSQKFAPALAGRLNTTLNVLVFSAAFAAQWGIGAIISHWPGGASGGHDPAGYRAAFAVVLTLQIITLAWFVLFRRRRAPLG
jgi:sugar phosphate permease